MYQSGINDKAVETFAAGERERFLQRNPKSVELAKRARKSLFGGVPMHWMSAVSYTHLTLPTTPYV